jgi:hypothetical protein
MQTTTIEQAAEQIKRAYRIHTGASRGDWMSLTSLAEMVDLTNDDITAAIRHLSRTESHFNHAPESNQKMLTAADHAAAVWIGCQWHHLICWF